MLRISLVVVAVVVTLSVVWMIAPAPLSDRSDALVGKSPDVTGTIGTQRQTSRLVDAQPEAVPDQRLRMNRMLAEADQLPLSDLRENVDILRVHPPEARREEWLLWVNQIMETFRNRADIDREEYIAMMLAIVADPGMDPVVWDYAIQHSLLAEADFERKASAAAASEPNEVQRHLAARTIYDIIEQSTIWDNQTALGTALLGISDLVATGSDLDAPFRDRVAAVVGEIIRGERPVASYNRVAAIHAAGRLRSEACAEDLAAIVQRGDEHLSLRLSSIAALGEFARSKDVRLLKAIAIEEETLRYSAEQSLLKIRANRK